MSARNSSGGSKNCQKLTAKMELKRGNDHTAEMAGVCIRLCIAPPVETLTSSQCSLALIGHQTLGCGGKRLLYMITVYHFYHYSMIFLIVEVVMEVVEVSSACQLSLSPPPPTTELIA